MNNKLKEIFRGKVVNKAHTINTGVDEFPRYVLEYLIDNYCAEETFHEDMEKVNRRLKDSFVYGAETEIIRHYIRENRRHSVIANLEVRLEETPIPLPTPMTIRPLPIPRGCSRTPSILREMRTR